MKVLPTEAKTYVVFCDYFKIFFGSTDFKYLVHLKTNNLSLCLNHEYLKSVLPKNILK
jgi:hypothetical protein